MVVGIHCHLCQMGDADDLPVAGNLLELLPNLLRCLAADTGVNLVKDGGRDAVLLCQHILDGKHHAGQLAARGNLCQRLWLFAHVGAKQKFQLVLSVRFPPAPARADAQAHRGHIQKFQLLFDPRQKFLCRFVPLAGQQVRCRLHLRL